MYRISAVFAITVLATIGLADALGVTPDLPLWTWAVGEFTLAFILLMGLIWDE